MWSRTWPTHESVPCFVYPAAKGWNVLSMSIQYTVRANPGAAFLIFCLDDLPIGESRAWKSPTIIVWELISHFKSISACFTKFGVPAVSVMQLESSYLLVELLP